MKKAEIKKNQFFCKDFPPAVIYSVQWIKNDKLFNMKFTMNILMLEKSMIRIKMLNKAKVTIFDCKLELNYKIASQSDNLRMNQRMKQIMEE
jgi:hypothetical protein